VAKLQVVTEQVDAAAAKVSGVGAQIAGGASWLGEIAGAAEGTTAAAACHAAASRWQAAFPAYADVANALSSALSAAAECYRQADKLPVDG
jgi:hypothetical protein